MMRLNQAMMTAVVAALIVTASRHATAQSTAAAGAGNPRYELIDLPPGDGMASEFDGGLPLAADSGVVMSNHLPDSAAVQMTGFDTADSTGMQNYAAGALGAPVPEPAAVAMLVAGLATLAAAARRRARHAG